MLAAASKPLGVWFGMTGDAESGSPADRFFLIGLALSNAAVVFHRRFAFLASLRQNGWLLALLAYMLISTAWSDISLIALRRLARDSIVLVVAAAVMSEKDPRAALESILRRTAYVLVPSSLLLIKYYPRLGVEYGRWSGALTWIGVTDQKNTLGRLCLVSAFFLIWSLYRHRHSLFQARHRWSVWGDTSVLFITLILIKGPEGAYSATSLATLAIGLFTLTMLGWLRRGNVAIPTNVAFIGAAVVIVYGLAVPFYGGANLGALSSSLGRNETLTGRTNTWAELVPVVKAHVVLGHGFGSFWTTSRRTFYDMSHGHNGYLDTMLELGAAGMGVYTLWLLSCARKFADAVSVDHHWAHFALSFLMMALVYNYTESALNGLAHPLTALLVLLSFSIPPRLNETARRDVIGRKRQRGPSSFYEPNIVYSRPRVGMRMHLSPQRNVGAAVVGAGAATDRRIVRIFGRGYRQRL